MPTFLLGQKRFRRKNFYMPCVIADDLDEKTPEELAEIYKATWWADLITEAEWKVLLDHDDATAAAKSRLKKKMTGWWMALSRISILHPELYEQSVKAATKLYEAQLREPIPIFRGPVDSG